MKLKLLILAILPLPLFGQPGFSDGGSGETITLPDSTIFQSEMEDSLKLIRDRDDAAYHQKGDTLGLSGRIDLKANIVSPTFTGTITIPTPFTLGATSVTPDGTELNVLDGIPGTLTATELGYVDGVTSAIQAQLDAKKAANDSIVNSGYMTQYDKSVLQTLILNAIHDSLVVIKNQIIDIYLALAGETPPSLTAHYMATTGAGGNDSAVGDYYHPWATLNYAKTQLSAGDTLYIRGGTYLSTTPTSGNVYSFDGIGGTKTAMINIWAYPGEQPVFDFSGITSTGTLRGFYLIEEADHLYFKGLELTGLIQSTTAVHYGFFLGYGADSNIIEECKVHNIDGYGFFTFNQDAVCTGNLWYKCDSYMNGDSASASAYALGDGFTVNYGSVNEGSRNTFRKCRSWWNGDDGWDFNGNNGYVFIDSCWAFRNGFIPGTYDDSGNGGYGFKMGGTDGTSDTLRQVTNSIAFDNENSGWNTNDADTTQRSLLYNCTAYRNTSYGIHLRKNLSIVKNCIAYGNGTETYFYSDVSLHATNSWTGVVTCTDADFASLDTTGVTGARQANGNLPALDFLTLETGSDLIDAGTDVGLPYEGTKPDMGAFEKE